MKCRLRGEEGKVCGKVLRGQTHLLQESRGWVKIRNTTLKNKLIILGCIDFVPLMPCSGTAPFITCPYGLSETLLCNVSANYRNDHSFV